MPLYLTLFPVHHFQMLFLLAKKLQKTPSDSILNHYGGCNISLRVLLVSSLLQFLQIPFKFHLKSSCPFQESFRVFFFPKWTCGLQGSQSTCLCHITQKHVLASSCAASQALARGPIMSGTHVVR